MDEKTKNGIFREWVEDYYEYGFRIAFKIMGNEDESRDILQDAFLKVWQKIDSYRTEVKFSTWLFSIISNLCFDRLRKKKVISNYSERFALSRSANIENSERALEEKEIRTVINRLTEFLSPKQKIAFVLRDMEELEMDEVCSITGMTTEQVKSNLYYARKAMHKHLISLKIMEDKV